MSEYNYTEEWEKVLGNQDQLDVDITDDLPNTFYATVEENMVIGVTVVSRNLTPDASERTVKELTISPQLVDELYHWLHGIGEYDGWPETAFRDYDPEETSSD